MARSKGLKHEVRIIEITRQRTQMKMQTKVNNVFKRKKLNEKN